jgi:hypothetical protein
VSNDQTMSYKGSENSSVDAGQQAQITTNAQAIAALQTEVTADEVLISANTTAIQDNRTYADAISARVDMIGTTLQIPVSQFPGTVSISNAGEWFLIPGSLQVPESGLYLVSLIVTSAVNSNNDIQVQAGSNGLSVWGSDTGGVGPNRCTVMGNANMISSYRQNNQSGIANNLQCLVRLTKNDVISFTMFTNLGFGFDLHFPTNWANGDPNQWPRDAVNANLSGILVTLLSLT